MGEGHRQRLFAKYSRGGIRSLCEEEIIELLLFLAIPRKDTRPIAAALIEKFGNLVGVLEAPRKEFENIDGIGEHASLILSFINDLLFYYRKDKRKYFKKQTYTDDIGEYLADTYGNGGICFCHLYRRQEQIPCLRHFEYGTAVFRTA